MADTQNQFLLAEGPLLYQSQTAHESGERSRNDSATNSRISSNDSGKANVSNFNLTVTNNPITSNRSSNVVACHDNQGNYSNVNNNIYANNYNNNNNNNNNYSHNHTDNQHQHTPNLNIDNSKGHSSTKPKGKRGRNGKQNANKKLRLSDSAQLDEQSNIFSSINKNQARVNHVTLVTFANASNTDNDTIMIERPSQNNFETEPIIGSTQGALENLPEDLKNHILGFLNGFDYVSLLFVNKSMSKLYWTSIVTLIATTPHQMDVMNVLLEKIYANYPYQLLLLKNVGFWSTPGKIKNPVSRRTMQILHLCRNVVRLIFGKGQYVMSHVTADDFKLLRSLQNLELIEVDHMDLPAQAFTSPCGDAKCSFSGCTYCTAATSHPFGGAASLIEHFPNLKSFRVRGINCNPDHSILALLKNCVGMKRIGIWGSGQISETEIFSLSALHEITELILSSCSSASDREVFKILVQMKLKHLGLFYAQNNNSGQDDDFKILSEIPSLTSLHLGGWNLTNNAFRHLASNSNLLNLSISRAQSISREGITEISRNSTITTLRISACIFLRDFDLAPIVFMKQLQRLDLDNTKSVTDNFLKFLAEKAAISEISELYLMGIPLISDKGILYLENFSSLKTLVIKNCQNVTEESVKKLKENHMSSWLGKLLVSLDNSEYIQKQQQQQLQMQQQLQQQQQQIRQQQLQQQLQQYPLVQQPHTMQIQPVTQIALAALHQQLQQIESQVQQQLSQIAEQQPLQDEQGLQTAYQYQEQLQQLHNLLHSQQRIQQQIQQQHLQPPSQILTHMIVQGQQIPVHQHQHVPEPQAQPNPPHIVQHPDNNNNMDTT